jgi:superfamily II DNA/RNA helicase
MSFENLNLHPKLLKVIKELGYVSPTPIQRDAIPIIEAGRDLRASAQTGTGKTGAFLFPLLNRLINPSSTEGQGPRALILVPTRELAMQVAAESEKYSKYLSRMKTVCLYGGVPYGLQIRALSRPYEILVATPGRLIDHYEQERIDFSRLEVFILDEADRMLDMGFISSVEQLAASLPKDVQTLLFSATLKGNIYNLSKRLLKDPVEVSVTPEQQNKDNIEQHLYFVDSLTHKLKLLDHLLQNQALNQTIIFTSTKRYAEELVGILQDSGHEADALHGDMNQHRRSKTILKLRQGKTRILVATDVAARGIDVQAIGHVINFDLPINVEDYVHRIGRTGRADAKGTAISFASSQDMLMLKRIEQYIEQPITLQVVPGMEAQMKPNFNSPKGNPRNRNQRNRKPFQNSSKPRSAPSHFNARRSQRA